MKARTIFPLLLVLLATASVGLSAAKDKDKEREDPNVRSVQGVVQDHNEGLVEGAVVQLKNTKTLQVRSFITGADGTYRFFGLSTNVDYELKADYQRASSPVKTLSVFDSRKKAVINLKMEPKS